MKMFILIETTLKPWIEGSGFVFGTISFVDKVVDGVILMLIQNEMPNPVTEENGSFFVSILAYSCGVTSIFGVVTMMALYPFHLGQR